MTDYLTKDEYKQSSTGQDYANLIPGGNQAAQDAELVRKIHAATGIIDSFLTNSLIAVSTIELIRTRYQRDGMLSLHPDNAALNQLVALSVGTHAGNLVAVSDLTGAFPDQEQWVIPLGGLLPNTGISMGQAGSNQVLAKLTHIPGWTNTTLTSGPAANATSFTVADAAGLSPAIGSHAYGWPVRIIDGEFTETITVASVVGSTINCSALASAHAIGAVLSTLPGDIKEAAQYVTTACLRARTSDALVMQLNNMAPGVPTPGDSQRWKLLQDARALLQPYARSR